LFFDDFGLPLLAIIPCFLVFTFIYLITTLCNSLQKLTAALNNQRKRIPTPSCYHHVANLIKVLHTELYPASLPLGFILTPTPPPSPQYPASCLWDSVASLGRAERPAALSCPISTTETRQSAFTHIIH
jgi:hypothetical protein